MEDSGSGGGPDEEALTTKSVLRDHAPHPYQSLNADGEILAVNEAWAAQLGYDATAVRGDWFGSFLTEESAATFEDRFPEFLDAGQVTDVEYEIVDADGQVIPVSFDGHVEYDEEGDPVRTHCQFTDLRPMRERDEAIQRLSEYRRVISAVDRALVRIDDVHEMLERVTEVVSGSDRFGCSFIALTGEDSLDFVCGAGSSLDSADVRAFHTERYVSTVFEEGSLVIPDVTSDPFDQHPDGGPAHAGLGVALEQDGTKYGVFTVHFPPGEDPTDEEIELLEGLGADLSAFLRTRHLERDRQRKADRLETRERLFRRLHELTQAGLSAESEADLYEQVIEGMVDALGYPQVAILGFDQEAGALEVRGASDSFEAAYGELRFTPTDEPVWQVFQEEQTRIVDVDALDGDLRARLGPAAKLVAVPIGDYGMLLAKAMTDTIDDVDLEMMELCAAHCEAILGRIRREADLRAATAARAEQAERTEQLRRFMETMGRVQSALAQTETTEAMAAAVCEELVSTDLVEFAWIGRPQTTDTDLERVAWAGPDRGYLDAIDLTADQPLGPAQRAADSRSVIRVANVSEHLHEGAWAKEALSADYRSVIALPVMDENGVLYGVLSAYSTQVEAFEDTEGAALADVADLLATYHRVHAVRATRTRGERLELEFEIRDPSYPLLAVARRLETQLRFETVVGVREDSVRVLVEVADGASVAPETAADVTVVREADWFGSPSAGRLLLELVPPCLVTEVSKHGAEVQSAVVDPEAATVVLSYPANNPVRPLFELLQSLYTAVDLQARRQTTAVQSTQNGTVVDTLTDRQREIITAAYYGGYFDTPKAISGEDLAENFDISNSAVSKHLRAAQRSLLEHLLDSTSDNRGFNDQP